MANQTKLTAKQAKAIPKILAAKTYEEGCKAAGISKTCFYDWMQNETFRAEFDRQRDRIVEAAFGLLTASVEKAVSVLVGLLDCKDERLRRLTAKDILDQFLKHKEGRELEERVAALEEHVERR